MPNTDSTRKFVKRFFDADAPLPKDNLHIPEKVSSNRSHSQHDKYMCEMKENYTKFMLHWEYIKKKTLVRLAQQTGVYASPVQIATKVLHLYPHKTIVVYKVYETDREAK